MDKENNKPTLLLKGIFWALLAVLAVIASQMFIPAVSDFFRGTLAFLFPFIIWFLLGLALIFLTLKEKIGGGLKKFLLLTGASAAGFFISVFLHNVFYALDILTAHIIVLKYLMGILHLVFFIIAIFICPLAFLIGWLGTLVLFVRGIKPSQEKDLQDNY